MPTPKLTLASEVKRSEEHTSELQSRPHLVCRLLLEKKNQPASFGVAVSCTVCPTCALAVAGLTVTDATGTTVPVIVAPPDCPSLVAVMVATPAATPLTSPLPFTVATAALLVAHVTTRPVNGLPLASFGVAASCTACPTAPLAVAGVTVTDATGTTVTAMPAEPHCPSLAAVIV